MAIAPKISIRGELIAAAATDLRFARNSFPAAFRKRTTSQVSMLKAFTMRFPVMVSCKIF